MTPSPRSSNLRTTLVSAIFLLLLFSFAVFNILGILLYRPDLTWLDYDHESESLIEATRVPKIISSEASSLRTDVHTFQSNGDVTVGINAPRHPVFDILEHVNVEWESLLAARGGDVSVHTRGSLSVISDPPQQAQAILRYHRLQCPGITRSASKAIASVSSLDLFTPISPSLLSTRQRQAEILPDTFTLVIRSGVPSIIYGNLTASVSEKHRIRRVELLLNAIRSFSDPLPDLRVTFNLLSHPRHALHSQAVELLRALSTDRSLPNSPVRFRSRAEPSAMDTRQGRSIHADDLNFLERTMTTQRRWSWENACYAQLDVEDPEEEDERNDITPPIRFVASPEARSDPCMHRSLAELHPSYRNTDTIYHTRISPVFSETTAPWASDILLPPLDFFDSDYKEIGSTIPWENKTAGLFWREHPSGIPASHFIAQRQRLVELKTKEHNTIIPIDSEGFLIDHKRLIDIATFNFTQGDDNVEEEARWKFLIELGGGAQMRAKMASGSLVFRPLLFGDWVSEHSVPWVHYVPVQPDLSDLPSLIAFFERHDALALRIAKAGQTWAHERLSQARVRDALRQMFEEWTKLGLGPRNQRGGGAGVF